MVAIHLLATGRDADEWKQRVYQGDIVIFKNVPPLVAFCTMTDALIRAAFGDLDPQSAQFALDRQEYVTRVGELQKTYRAHPAIRESFSAVLEYAGVDPRGAGWDWLYLRVMPHGASHASRRTQKLGFHRDTWSSNVYAQLNWWTPIYLLAPRCALAFYPQYWSQPLANTSAAWDLEAIRAKRSNAPLVPEPSEPVDTASEVVIVPQPGDLLCFSGAHLHASVPNTSGVARFSIEVRTVDIADAARSRGAPNIDGEAPRIALDWFHRIADEVPLPDIIAAAR